MRGLRRPVFSPWTTYSAEIGDPSQGMQVRKGCAGRAGGACQGGQASGVREQGKIASMTTALKSLAAKSASQGRGLRFCYEAGPCGHGIQRQ